MRCYFGSCRIKDHSGLAAVVYALSPAEGGCDYGKCKTTCCTLDVGLPFGQLNANPPARRSTLTVANLPFGEFTARSVSSAVLRDPFSKLQQGFASMTCIGKKGDQSVAVPLNACRCASLCPASSCVNSATATFFLSIVRRRRVGQGKMGGTATWFTQISDRSQIVRPNAIPSFNRVSNTRLITCLFVHVRSIGARSMTPTPSNPSPITHIPQSPTGECVRSCLACLTRSTAIYDYISTP